MKFQLSALVVALTAAYFPLFSHAESMPTTDDEGYRQAGVVEWDKSSTSAYDFETDISLPPNKSRMVFMRAPDNQAVSTSVNIAVDGRFQSSLQGGYFSTTLVCQGTHEISTGKTGSNTNRLQDTQTFNTLPQKTQYYYVELDDSGQPMMRQITQESAISVMNNYEMAEQGHQISRVFDVCNAPVESQELSNSDIETEQTDMSVDASNMSDEEVSVTAEPETAEQNITEQSEASEIEAPEKLETEQTQAKFDFDKPLILNVFFSSGSAKLKSGYSQQLESLVKLMNLNEDVIVLIEGHTDNKGDSMYNLKLSQRRADAVKTELVDRYGANPLRINSIGYGETRPIKNNDTDEGKAANRRVVAVISVVD